jgi:hypothetical protein
MMSSNVRWTVIALTIASIGGLAQQAAAQFYVGIGRPGVNVSVGLGGPVGYYGGYSTYQYSNYGYSNYVSPAGYYVQPHRNHVHVTPAYYAQPAPVYYSRPVVSVGVGYGGRIPVRSSVGPRYYYGGYRRW